MRRFVANGGTAVITFFSGIVDAQDRVRLGGYPAPWRDLLGLRIEELAPLRRGAAIRLGGAATPGAAGSGRTSSTCVGRLRCSRSAKAISMASRP